MGWKAGDEEQIEKTSNMCQQNLIRVNETNKKKGFLYSAPNTFVSSNTKLYSYNSQQVLFFQHRY